MDASVRGARGYLGSHRQGTFLNGLVIFAGAVTLGALFAWAASGRLPTAREVLLLDVPVSVRETMLVWIAVFAVSVVCTYVFHDLLTRRRWRRWAIGEHGSKPMPVRHSFDAEGVSVADPNGSARRSWAAVTGLEETERQFFLVGAARDVLLVPKRDLSVADQQRVRYAVREAASAREPEPGIDEATLPAEATRDASVRLRSRQIEGDRVAASLLVSGMPSGRRRRARNAVVATLVVASGISIFDASKGYIEWFARSGSEPFGAASTAFVQAEAAGFRWPALYAAATGLGYWLLWPWLLRRQAVALARSREDRPVNLALGASGVATAVPGVEFHYAWSGVRAVLEGRDHVGQLLPLSVVLPVPKRELGPEQLAALRHLLAERVVRP